MIIHHKKIVIISKMKFFIIAFLLLDVSSFSHRFSFSRINKFRTNFLGSTRNMKVFGRYKNKKRKSNTFVKCDNNNTISFHNLYYNKKKIDWDSFSSTMSLEENENLKLFLLKNEINWMKISERCNDLTQYQIMIFKENLDWIIISRIMNWDDLCELMELNEIKNYFNNLVCSNIIKNRRKHGLRTGNYSYLPYWGIL